MKNKMSVLALGLTLLFSTANIANAAPEAKNTMKDSTYLIIYNNWNNTIHIKEGRLFKTDEDLPSGVTFSKAMSSGFVTSLSISYKKNGSWQEIPGCPAGTYHRNLNVFISAASWDPNTPVCQQG